MRHRGMRQPTNWNSPFRRGSNVTDLPIMGLKRPLALRDLVPGNLVRTGRNRGPAAFLGPFTGHIITNNKKDAP